MVQYGGADALERRAAIEERITAQRLVQMFDDDGDGLVAGGDLAKLDGTLADADDIVTGILLNKGFTLEQLEILKADRQVVRAWANIAAQLAGERKTEWLNERGEGPFQAFGERARAELKALARGDIRSVMEPEAGTNASVTVVAPLPDFQFAPDPRIPGDRGPGGF